MSLRIYNTLSHEKETFVPHTPGEVKMYLCGPTVYNFLHVGNFRGPIFFNLVRNWLERLGNKVTFVYNYTDVDDKIIDRAKADGVPAEEISERYIEEFQKDFTALGLKPHTHNPKVSDSMGSIIDMVKTLVEKEKAYVVNGEVLYSVKSFDTYGKLSRVNTDELQSGSRIEVDQKKRDPMDFALWKPAKPGEPKWPSPWSDGRPGWHIECSAMCQSILGESIDIHGGGIDLVFPHHENEIAQSEGASGKQFVKYWMHNNFITFGDRKMSKSLGNIRTAREFLGEYNAEIFKYMMLAAHYRSLLDFSEQSVEFAIAGLARIYSALNLAAKTLEAGQGIAPAAAPMKATAKALEDADKAVTEALNDDFNTPEVFAAIFTVIRSFNSSIRLGQKATPETVATAKAFRDWVIKQGELMALFQEAPAEYLRLLDDMLLEKKGLDRSKVDAMVAARSEVRAAKDFKKSDELRDELLKLGIAVQDMPQGSTWEVAK